MKRNMDLYRNLLLYVRDDNRLPGPEELNVAKAERDYHVWLLNNDQLLTGAVAIETQDGLVVQIARPPMVTSAAHDFLDAAENDTIWNKVKQQLSDAGMSLATVPFQVLNALLVKVASNQLGL